MLRILPLLLTLYGVCLLASCGSQRTSQSSVAPLGATSPKKGIVMPISEEFVRSRRFNELFLEAIRQKGKGNYDAAYELLAEGLRRHPDASEAVYEMAVLKLSFSTFSDTLFRHEGDSLLRRAVALEPDNLYYKETLATFFANRAQYREAIQLYEDIAETRLTYETLATLIWLYKTNGDYAGAIRTIERLERLDGKSELLSMEKFQTYWAMKDGEHAFQAIEDLCAEYPLDLRYRVLLGDMYEQYGYHERALDIYRDVLTAEPDNSYAQISLLAYYKAAGADSLYTDYLRRVVLNPHTQSSARLEAMRSYAVDNIKAHADSMPVIRLFHEALQAPQENRDMAELYTYYVVERKMPQDTLLTALNRMLRIEPDYTKARLQLLQMLIQRRDMATVAEICREGILYEPSEITYYYYQGTALYQLGQDMQAIKVLQKGVERIDENTDKLLASDVYALLGDVLHDHGLKEEAYLAYDRSLNHNATNGLCLNNYAYFLSLSGRNLDKAEEMSRRAVDLQSSEPSFLDTYAWILYLKKQYEQARIYIDEALRNLTDTPENASIFDHAGDIYYRCGKKAEALMFWKRALRLSADKDAQRKIQRKVWRKRP